jgi:bifunctional non-homologous end joining protein LigD
MKWDGVRVGVATAGGELRVLSRNDKDLSATYPELGELRDLVDRPVVLDGEVVALDAQGRPDFGALQARMHRHAPGPALLAATPVVYYVFDLLHVDGQDLTSRPYSERRELLDELALAGRSVVVPPRFVDVAGSLILATADEHGLEGVVAKKAGSRYEPGRRSRSWIKTPLRKTIDVVIGGWTEGEGRRTGTIGALILGVPEPGGLRFVGNVGTGFSGATLRQLRVQLAERARSVSPFDPAVPREFARHAHWVSPDLVGEVEYRAVTTDGRLRHPSWRGWRSDRTVTDLWPGQEGPKFDSSG